MTFRVETTAAAEQDVDTILDWLLSQHAGGAGIRWFLALQDAIASLAEFPERCPLAPERGGVSQWLCALPDPSSLSASLIQVAARKVTHRVLRQKAQRAIAPPTTATARLPTAVETR